MKTVERRARGKKPIIKIWKASSALPEGFTRWKTLKKEVELKESVKKIIETVKAQGDAALLEFIKKFDKVSLGVKNLKVTADEIEEAYSKVNEEQISALKSMKEKVESFEKIFLERIQVDVEIDGLRIQVKPYPIESVGCYVPGGKATYPSTLIMCTVPAKLARVPRVVVCSPPGKDGSVKPLTLVAAGICKVDEFYKVGGAQSIAAMAYGTETIKPVRKIVGPGSKYVTVAKLLVSEDVAIDMPAGPSELLVIADETANPRLIALDMCSQAEHGPDSVVGLLTTSNEVAKKVLWELERIVGSALRKDILMQALQNNGFIVVCENVERLIELVNLFAPEHVEIFMQNPEELAQNILSAGLILIGDYSPAALNDYHAGPNHVLPTSGFGKIYSGLSVLDFLRRVAIVKCSREGLAKTVKPIKVLAEAEDLPNHYKAVAGRFEVEN